MSTDDYAPMTLEELAAEGVTPLPDKEVVSILDLAADIDLAIDGAAPIDLAIALNANVVAPIDAAVSANLLSNGSTSQALADQGVMVTQTVDADAIATGVQDSTIDQSDTVTDGAAPVPTEGAGSDQAMAAATADAGDAMDASAAASGDPVDGSVVVDSAGNIVGTLDESTGTVVDADGNIVGTLNETTGLVVDSAGAIVGTVTSLVDGATVADASGNVIGVLDGATGTVVDASGNVVGALDPLTGQVVNTVGEVLGTVTDLVDGTTVLDSAGNVVGTLDGATGNVVDSAGNVIGALDPLTGQVLDAAGNIVGTVGNIVDDVTDTVGQLDTGDLLKGDLLNVDVNVDLDADLAAPINGAVAANANVAAPIDASVAANILSDDSQATALAQQDAIITQSITGTAEATSEQTSDIDQGVGRAAGHRHRVRRRRPGARAGGGPGTHHHGVGGRRTGLRSRRHDRADHGHRASVTTLVDAPARVGGVQLTGRRWAPATGPRRPWSAAATARPSSSRPCSTWSWTPSTGSAPAPRSPRSSAGRCAGGSPPTWSRGSSTSTCARWGCSRSPTGPIRRSSAPTRCWASR